MEHCRHIYLCVVLVHARMTDVSQKTSLYKQDSLFKLHIMHFGVLGACEFVRASWGYIVKIYKSLKYPIQNVDFLSSHTGK